MISSGPMPGNPWPRDMVIAVEDDSNTLLDLLWIREAWTLRPLGDDLPPSLSDGSVSADARPGPSDLVSRWSDCWPAMWKACLRHAGELRDGSKLFARLEGTPFGSPERADLLNAFLGPSWRREYGDEAFTDDYANWKMARFEAVTRRQHQSLEEDPERRSLTALVPAWQAGLGKIVTIPCTGTFTRMIGPHAMMVTEETRADPRRYSEALAQFRSVG